MYNPATVDGKFIEIS